MNEYLSNKIKTISFILMILVVLIHSNNTNIELFNGNLEIKKGYSYFVQYFFTEGITRIAVPMFFVISGYLFFLKLNGTFKEFLRKYKSRIKTLVLPYILWSIWGLTVYFILQSFPESKSFFVNEMIKDYSLKKLIHTIFLNPVTFQFWFIRDLIIIVFLSPIILFIFKYLKHTILYILFIIWILNFNFIIFYNDSFLFFILGAYIAIEKNNLLLTQFSNSKYITYLYVWLGLVLCYTILFYINFSITSILITIQKMSILIGMFVLWSIYDITNLSKFKNKIMKLSAYTFFIYAFHEPTLLIIKKALIYYLGKSEFYSLCIFVVAPLSTIIISLIVAHNLKLITPKFYSLITGGR